MPTRGRHSSAHKVTLLVLLIAAAAVMSAAAGFAVTCTHAADSTMSTHTHTLIFERGGSKRQTLDTDRTRKQAGIFTERLI